MDSYTLEAGSILRVDGPATVRVITGRIYVLGVEYGVNDRITIMRGRRVIIKTLEKSTLELIIGPEGNAELANEEDQLINQWETTLNSIVSRGSTYVILGAMDVGKTTITTILVNKGVARKLKVGVIDGDPGQNDIGPPTTVSSAVATNYITHLSQLKMDKSVFVKTTSVEHVWRDVINGITKLRNDLLNRHGVDMVVINTDGWVSGEDAINYKLELIRSVGATHVIILRRNNETDELIERVRGEFKNVYVLPSPPNARIRDREDRKIRREMGYGRYIMPPRELSLSLRRTPIVNMPILHGSIYDNNMLRIIRKSLGPISYMEQWGGVAIAVGHVKEAQFRNIGGVTVLLLPNDWERGLLVALEDRDNYLLTLGVLRRIYYSNGKAVIAVPRTFDREGEIHHIRLGMVRLNENFEEVEKAVYISRVESLLTAKPQTILNP
ncbi:Clp1/GlmU family protein [Vulcanisaeta thermophila]|uniref:Clp1/GlmU family protein n=1 Tax=Vulcanisaeta thermophila TaxID=867917 RepID=UPI0008529016|nr:Clp1/GlmU family protein [Vulcanisaeta thermophila]